MSNVICNIRYFHKGVEVRGPRVTICDSVDSGDGPLFTCQGFGHNTSIVRPKRVNIFVFQ